MGDDTVTVAKWKMYTWVGLGIVGGYHIWKYAVRKIEEMS